MVSLRSWVTLAAEIPARVPGGRPELLKEEFVCLEWATHGSTLALPTSSMIVFRQLHPDLKANPTSCRVGLGVGTPKGAASWLESSELAGYKQNDSTLVSYSQTTRPMASGGWRSS